MKTIARFVLPFAAAMFAACVAPTASRAPMAETRIFPAGEDQLQLVVVGYGVDRLSLLELLHQRASKACGWRGYSISETTATGTARLLRSPEDLDDPVEETAVSALVSCGPMDRVARKAEPGARDGRPYCAERDPELERLRPRGYVSPEEEQCIPAPGAPGAAAGAETAGTR